MISHVSFLNVTVLQPDANEIKLNNNQSNAPFMAKYIVLILTEKKETFTRPGVCMNQICKV